MPATLGTGPRIVRSLSAAGSLSHGVPLGNVLRPVSDEQQKAADLRAIQNIEGLGPVFISDEYIPGTAIPTMYEDSAGVTPVSVGGVAGLWLDVSQNASLGPEIASPSSWSFTANGSTQTKDLSAAGTLTVGGPYYRFDLYVDSYSGTNTCGFVTALFGTPGLRAGVGRITGIAQAGENKIRITVRADQTVSFSAASVRLLAGSHAIQATTANKSTLRVTPHTCIRWLDAATAAAAMTVTLPAAITNARTFVATPVGVVETAGVNLGSSYSITGPYLWFSASVTVNEEVHVVTPAERAAILRFLGHYVPVLGKELFANPSFDAAGGWSISNSAFEVTGNGVATRIGTASGYLRQMVATIGSVYYLQVVTQGTPSNLSLFANGISMKTAVGGINLASFVSTANYGGVITFANGSSVIESASLRQIL